MRLIGASFMTTPDSLAAEPEADATPTSTPQPSTEDQTVEDEPAQDQTPLVERRRRRVSRRQVLAYGATTAGALAVGGIVGAAVQRGIDAARIPPTIAPEALLNDASRLNPTPVRGVIFAGSSATSTAEVLSPLLRRIAEGQDPALAVCGVRHSMGGQSLLRDGWILDMQRLSGVELDTARRVMRVGAGATWSDVIPVLNAAGLAPTVMQSNHDFSVGGSLSVNCHGWHTNSSPIAGTVQSLRLLTADGVVVECSPQTNTELFTLALGGYGLYGIILDADLAIVPNVMYTPEFVTVSTKDYATTFTQRVYEAGSPVEMAYGRLSVVPDFMLEEAIIATFKPVPDTRGAVLALTPALNSEVARAIYRNSANGGAEKILRWWLEREAGPWLADDTSRNNILNEPSAIFANRTQDTTDILHEYFVPQARLWEFVGHAKEIIRRAPGNLLNVTVRDVRRDARSVLAYAHEDVFGLVMSFLQERSASGEERMQTMTRELIDAAIAAGGSFYLPYRLHATNEQLRRAYPNWEAAMQAKDRYDPKHIFQNGLFGTYGRA
jgi:FAD/FMN-containing dehydrogenase